MKPLWGFNKYNMPMWLFEAGVLGLMFPTWPLMAWDSDFEVYQSGWIVGASLITSCMVS